MYWKVSTIIFKENDLLANPCMTSPMDWKSMCDLGVDGYGW